MNEQDKQALDLIAQALEPGVKITRNGYAQLEQALMHIAKRLQETPITTAQPEPMVIEQ